MCLVLGIWEQTQGQAHSVSGPEYKRFRFRHMQCLCLDMGWVPSHWEWLVPISRATHMGGHLTLDRFDGLGYQCLWCATWAHSVVGWGVHSLCVFPSPVGGPLLGSIPLVWSDDFSSCQPAIVAGTQFGNKLLPRVVVSWTTTHLAVAVA